jgi:hypothetical protein
MLLIRLVVDLPHVEVEYMLIKRIGDHNRRARAFELAREIGGWRTTLQPILRTYPDGIAAPVSEIFEESVSHGFEI